MGKNTICREILNSKSMDRMIKADSPHLQTFTVNNARGKKHCSAAMNCKHVLEKKVSKGVKSGVQRERWAPSRDAGKQEIWMRS